MQRAESPRFAPGTPIDRNCSWRDGHGLAGKPDGSLHQKKSGPLRMREDHNVATAGRSPQQASNYVVARLETGEHAGICDLEAAGWQVPPGRG